MELNNNRFSIQGVDLLETTNTYGTPVYLYDAEVIKSQYNKLINAFPTTKIKLKYAAKALTNISILKYLRSLGAGLDAVSIQEVELGIMAGFDPEEIMYTPNGVSFDEIKEGVDKGVMLNIDNISILEQFGNEYKNTIPVCIRLNPHLMAGGNHKISTGHIDSKFGVSILQTRHLLRVINTYNINVVGVHMHTGSDILDADVFLNGAKLLFDLARDLKDIEFIDFGSGFKVPYHESDVHVNVAELGKKISKAFNDFCEEYGRDLELWFEPGKYLVSEAGVLLAKTNVVKTTPATVFAGVDSGLNHLIRPMMYDAYHDIVNISNTAGTKRVYTIVGYICETDTFGWDRQLYEISEGDILAIKNAGAYGYSMSSNYNSRFRPAEVLIIDGKAHLIRKRETLEDITRNQVDVDI
jgi:diaminopimelate decarboxylase